MKLRRLIEVFSPRWRRPAVCEACGNPFSCGASLSGCWCSEIQVSDEVRAELKSRYRDCLCRTCLEKIAGSSALGKEV